MSGQKRAQTDTDIQTDRQQDEYKNAPQNPILECNERVSNIDGQIDKKDKSLDR